MDTKIITDKGDAYCQKIDIFKNLMWFSYANAPAHWHVLNQTKLKKL